MAATDLSRTATKEQLATYLSKYHEPLVQLLPEDTSCDDIFGEVDAGRSINSQFLPSEDSHIHREVLRFTRKIEQWLKEEKALTKVKEKQAKRDAWHAAYKEKQAAKKPKLEPPAPPVMAFSDAQIVAEHTANKKLESARERLLEQGYTGRFRVPGDNASPHQKFFKESPQAVCKQLGIEFVGEKFGMYIIYFPGTALEAFEKAKREVKSKESGKGKNKIVTPMPYRNYKLPTTGEVITWQDFFGTLIARAYKESDIAAFKIVTKHSSAEIEAMGKAKVREVQSKYEVKLERASTEIADCELKHEQAKDSAVKEALAKQLGSHRAARNALLAKQDEEITALELQYDGYKEMARTREKLIAEKNAKSQEAAAALFRRREAAGGATAEDGAAALAAVAGPSGVVPAPPTAEAQAAMPLAADESDDGLDGF